MRDSQTPRSNSRPAVQLALSGAGFGIHWPDVDEDLSTAGLLLAIPATEQPVQTVGSMTRGKGDRREGDRAWLLSVSLGNMSELVFEAFQEDDGGFHAECLTENIFAQGDTWDELRTNTVEATAAFFFDHPGPKRIRLHLVRDEVLSVA